MKQERVTFTFPEIAGQLATQFSLPCYKLRCQFRNLATTAKAASLHPLSTITALLEPHAGGSLHLPFAACAAATHRLSAFHGSKS